MATEEAMTDNPCAICQRPQADTAVACATCAARIARHLDVIVEYTPDARAVAAGQTRRGPAQRGNGGDRLPINLAAGARLDAVQNALTTWARHVADERGQQVPAGADPLITAARWLGGQVEWARHRQEVGELARDVAAVVRVVSGIVDRPAERRYAGPCSSVDDDGKTCGADLYARAGRNVAVCRVCGWEYDVDAQQEWMRGEVREKLARPVEIAGILLRLGFPIAYSTVAAYAEKGLIVAVRRDARDRELYRIGDVIDVRESATTRQHQRSA